MVEARGIEPLSEKNVWCLLPLAGLTIILHIVPQKSLLAHHFSAVVCLELALFLDHVAHFFVDSVPFPEVACIVLCKLFIKVNTKLRDPCVQLLATVAVVQIGCMF